MSDAGAGQRAKRVLAGGLELLNHLMKPPVGGTGDGLHRICGNPVPFAILWREL